MLNQHLNDLKIFRWQSRFEVHINPTKLFVLRLYTVSKHPFWREAENLRRIQMRSRFKARNNVDSAASARMLEI